MGFKIPSIGEINVLQILRTAPDGFRVRLHQNELDPEDDFDPDSLVPADFNGNTWEEVADPGWDVPQENALGHHEIMSQPQVWELEEDGTPQTVRGWSLWHCSPDGDRFIGLEQFDSPFVLAEPGDKIERFFRFTATNINLE